MKESQNTQKKQFKYISKHRKKNHLQMNINFANEKDMREMIKNLKKTIHKKRHQINGGVSYEIYCNVI